MVALINNPERDRSRPIFQTLATNECVNTGDDAKGIRIEIIPAKFLDVASDDFLFGFVAGDDVVAHATFCQRKGKLAYDGISVGNDARTADVIFNDRADASGFSHAGIQAHDDHASVSAPRGRDIPINVGLIGSKGDGQSAASASHTRAMAFSK